MTPILKDLPDREGLHPLTISEPTVFLPLHLSNQPELANFMLRTTQTNHGGLNGMEIW
jgi:hypothetical protein